MTTVAILPISDASGERIYRAIAICNRQAIAHPKIIENNISQQLAV
ncbi:hypothetical protein [Coleofasciculus sp. FACHB-SPT9]|nr:hypothetical protein [Coleofasciculus sp. FACHB-SPT9]